MSKLENLKKNKEIPRLKMRRMNMRDKTDLFKWRNHPDIRKNFFNEAPVSSDEHDRWFKTKYNDKNTTIYMAYYERNKIGIIRFEDMSDVIKISITINPDFLFKGFGAIVISNGIKKFISEKGINKPFVAEIKGDNLASIKVFKKAGFRRSHVIYVYK